MDIYEKIMELSQKGYHCSQIVMMMVLEATGEGPHPNLIRSLGGLGGGIGFSGHICGCVTGGACAISYFMGKKGDEDKEDPIHQKTVKELLDWYYEEIGDKMGGRECKDITNLDWNIILQKCPDIVARTFEKTMELLTERGAIDI